jgi:hypothetical protein
MEVPRYDTRLEALVFKLQFKNESLNLERSLKTVKAATHEVLSSQKLRRLLEVVLKVMKYNIRRMKSKSLGQSFFAKSWGISSFAIPLVCRCWVVSLVASQFSDVQRSCIT